MAHEHLLKPFITVTGSNWKTSSESPTLYHEIVYFENSSTVSAVVFLGFTLKQTYSHENDADVFNKNKM